MKEIIPKDWAISMICPIYKKGDKAQCSNYQGVSLLCTAYKISTTILLNRLKPYSENIIGEYQAGFRKGRSTIDQIYAVIKQVLGIQCRCI
jgi:hypothetical protein